MSVFNDGVRTDRRKATWLFGCVVLVLLLTAMPSLAQSTSTILGVVEDASGGVVPQAKVTVVNTDTNQSRTVTTSDDGEFRFPALATGHYSLKIEKNGFKTETQTGLTLEVAQELVLNTALQVGTSAQEVVVIGEAPLVNTTNSATGALVNEEKMSDLPLNGRNYVDLATIQPGVQATPLSPGGGAGVVGSAFSSNGSPIRSNNFTIDGASMLDQTSVSTSSIDGTTLGVDGIKEYKVVTHSFSAEYGLVMGSQIQIVSKGGSNRWSGDAFDYLRNSVLDARNFFDHASKIPEFQRNNFGGSFGGPIKKDKTFFYGVYEGLRENLGITVLSNVPPAACHQLVNPGTNSTTLSNPAGCAAGLATSTIIPQVIQPWLAQYALPNVGANQFTFPAKAPVRVDFGQMRVDHAFSDSDSFFSRYTIDDGSLVNPTDTTALQFSGAAFPQYSLVGQSRNQFLTLSENHIFSPMLLNQFRMSYSRPTFFATTVWNTTPLNPQGVLIGPQYSLVTGYWLGPISVSGLTNFGAATSYPITRNFNVYTLSDDIFFTRGRHAFKFGTLVNRYDSGVTAQFSRPGSIQFANLASFMQGKAQKYTAFTNYPGMTFNIDSYEFVWNTLGFYAQDDWRATSRLTLNLGLRYEIMTSLHGKHGIQSSIPNIATDSGPTIGPPIRNYTLKDLSPRLGFAWDVTGKGKTSLRGGAGIYFDVGNISGPLLTDVAGDPPFLAQSSVQVSSSAGVITLPLTFPPGTVGTSAQLIDYNMKQPYSIQESLTFEQQLPFNMGLSVGYVGNHGIHMTSVLEGNPCKPTAVTNGVPSWVNATNTACPLGRVNTAFQTINLTTAPSTSYYNALQVVVNKRVSHGLEIQASYVWSHSTDTTLGGQPSADCGANSGNYTVPNYTENLRRFAYGPSCFDLRNVWHANVLYHLPNVKTNAFVSKVLNGWWMGGILTVQGGYPFTPALSANRSLSGNRGGAVGDYPNLATAADVTTCPAVSTTCKYVPVPYDASTAILGNPTNWFNPFMFTLAPVGTLGNVPRGLLRGPHLSNLDFSLNKDTAFRLLGERGMLQFRAEMFNILNHTNFGYPSSTTFAGTATDTTAMSEVPIGATTNPFGTAGQITSTATTSRQIQLALKIIF